MTCPARSIVAAILLLLLPRLASGRPRLTNGASDRRDCSREHMRKRRLALWPKKRQRRTTRQAYRMAILSSLAYHDFRDDKHLQNDEGSGSWAFSLVDDPSPARYLLESPKSSGDDREGTKVARAQSRGRKRDRLRRAVARLNARFRVSLCQTRYSAKQMLSKSYNATDAMQQCKQKVRQKNGTGKRYQVEWVFNNWHEQGKGLKWHDTDLIIATSGTSEIVLAFAGTASSADAVTNIQTLEPVSHSGLFEQSSHKANAKNVTLEGGMHRGFLNAYARVVRGKIRKLGGINSGASPTRGLEEYFQTCILQQSRPKKVSRAVATIPKERGKSNNAIQKLLKGALSKRMKRRDAKRRRRNQVCHSNGSRLMDILRDVTTKSLKTGHTVHLVGHSLAGSLASIHALDVAMNFPNTPIKRLHLWTFGAPEIADSRFYESAGAQSRRVRMLFSDEARYHRYVTQSRKNCKTDMIASVTSKSLNNGPAMRRIGGVQGDVVHTIEPSFLPCNATGGELHEMKSYLGALSTSAFQQDTQLKTDFPPRLRKWLGETV